MPFDDSRDNYLDPCCMRFRAAARIAFVLAGCGGGAQPSTLNSAGTSAQDSTLARQGHVAESHSQPLGALPAPPPTRRENVIDVYHGVRVIDPYRWLESESVERVKWYATQNDYARRILDAIPGRDRLRAELRETNRDFERVDVLGVVGEAPRVFSLRRGADDESSKLVVRDGWHGTDRVLVDPNKRRNGAAHANINGAFPSPDGRYVAYVLATAGSDDGTMEIVDVKSGRVLMDRIDRVSSRISWRPDGRSLFYRRRAKPEPGATATDWFKNSATHLHTFGAEPKPNTALPVIAPSMSELGLRPHDLTRVEVTPRSRWALAVATPGAGDSAFYIAALTRVKPGATRWRRVATMKDKVRRILVHRNRVYVLTYADAPNYRIVSFDAKSGSLANASTFMAASELVLVDCVAARDAMYVVALDRGLHRLFQVAWKTAAATEIALPFEGAIGKLVADGSRSGLVFNVEGWIRPPTWFEYDPAAGIRELPTSSSTTTVEGFIAEQATVVSRDGSEVPLSIIRRQGKALDGSTPALLYGYGAYGFVNNPRYNPLILAWVKRGGIYATCHVRGGGERGKAWHLAGIKEKKENGVDDFISCAEYMIGKRYAAPARLTAIGPSAGGIVVGGAITKRPDLFKATVVQVGQLNPLRKEVTEGGHANAREYGDVKIESEFHSLLASDPYHRIREGVEYPAVLLIAGLHDRRVAPWVPGKFAARLQATGRARPTLLRLDLDDGHGVGSTQSQREEEYADIYAFALWQSGVN